MNAFNITKNKEDGKYLYHEFVSSYGKKTDSLDDFYKNFDTLREAKDFAKKRGAFYVYEKSDYEKLDDLAVYDKFVYKNDLRDLLYKKLDNDKTDNRFLLFEDEKGRDVLLGLKGREGEHSIELWHGDMYKEYGLLNMNELAIDYLAECIQKNSFKGQCVVPDGYSYKEAVNIIERNFEMMIKKDSFNSIPLYENRFVKNGENHLNYAGTFRVADAGGIRKTDYSSYLSVYPEKEKALNALAHDVLVLEEKGFPVDNLRKVMEIYDEGRFISKEENAGEIFAEQRKVKELLKERKEYFSTGSDDYINDFKAEKEGYYVVGVEYRKEGSENVDRILTAVKVEEGRDIFDKYRKYDILNGFYAGCYPKKEMAFEKIDMLCRSGFFDSGDLVMMKLREEVEEKIREGNKTGLSEKSEEIISRGESVKPLSMIKNLDIYGDYKDFVPGINECGKISVSAGGRNVTGDKFSYKTDKGDLFIFQYPQEGKNRVYVFKDDFGKKDIENFLSQYEEYVRVTQVKIDDSKQKVKSGR